GREGRRLIRGAGSCVMKRMQPLNRSNSGMRKPAKMFLSFLASSREILSSWRYASLLTQYASFDHAELDTYRCGVAAPGSTPLAVSRSFHRHRLARDSA